MAPRSGTISYGKHRVFTRIDTHWWSILNERQCEQASTGTFRFWAEVRKAFLHSSGLPLAARARTKHIWQRLLITCLTVFLGGGVMLLKALIH